MAKSKQLRVACLALGVPAYKFAASIGVSPTMVSFVAAGKATSKRVEVEIDRFIARGLRKIATKKQSAK